MNPMLGMLLQQGLAAWQGGKPDQARLLFNAVLQMDARNFDALHLLGLMAADSGRHEEAIALYERALGAAPREAQALLNMASSLRRLKRHEDALMQLDAALRLAPGMAEAHHNRGNVLREMGRAEEALLDFARALQIVPNDADCHEARGTALFALGRFDEAHAAFAAALALRPGHPNARWNASLLALLQGDLPAAWEGYEAGGEVGTRDIRRNFGKPVWRGTTPLAGQRILLHAEQGLGDTLQFCRYARRVKDAGAAEVILEVQAPLRRLLDGLDGVDRLCVRGEALPAFDLSCPLLSLPACFGSTLADLPPPARFPQAAQAEQISSARPRIALVWSGNPEHVNDRERSLPLRALKPLFDADLPVQWVSLQLNPRPEDAVCMQTQACLEDATHALQDFADTARRLQDVTLLISADTAVAHLAASLGKPVWLLLPPVPDWRWLLGREDSPWYPTMRLFRRTQGESWHNVVEERLLPALCSRLTQGERNV
ncbi:MAG: hypothetical protein H6R19_1003 [Proteobacteria bacterium]|nr:hypothetical protein [Pseudomonadota bacterium]